MLEQHCPSEPAILDFHDEVMVKSQVGSSYRTNVSCAMSLKPAKEELGLIAVALFGETASHTDRMEVGPGHSWSNVLPCAARKRLLSLTGTFAVHNFR